MGRNRFVVFLGLVLFSNSLYSQDVKIKLGAYYFDGWTGKTYHTSDKMRSFTEREPIWGWITSTPEIMDKQINLASDAGLDFFNFCWYYTGVHGKNIQIDPKNNALNLFRNSSLKPKMEFSLLIANHGQYYTIKPEHWDYVTDYWISLFLDPQYVMVDDKPLITFFDIGSLRATFGNSVNVKKALDEFRAKAVNCGLNGLSIAACLDPSDKKIVQVARECGIDILTSYNSPEVGFDDNKVVTPIENLISKESKMWDTAAGTNMPYIPTATLNWDPRPWIADTVSLDRVPRFSGYSQNSVYKSVKAIREWVEKNPRLVTKEKIAFLYAWNEYGEGAWLTPSKDNKNNYLKGVKRALR